jgi:hypothetical protein
LWLLVTADSTCAGSAALQAQTPNRRYLDGQAVPHLHRHLISLRRPGTRT